MLFENNLQIYMNFVNFDVQDFIEMKCSHSNWTINISIHKLRSLFFYIGEPPSNVNGQLKRERYTNQCNSALQVHCLCDILQMLEGKR